MLISVRRPSPQLLTAAACFVIVLSANCALLAMAESAQPVLRSSTFGTGVNSDYSAAPTPGRHVTDRAEEPRETIPPPSSSVVSGWQAAFAEGKKRLKLNELVHAEICFREALKEVRRVKPKSVDDIVLCQNNLAAVLQLEDLTQDVLPLYKKSLKMLERKYGKNSTKLVDTLVALADVNRNETIYRKAAKYYQDALTILEKNSLAQSIRYADAQYRLGLTFSKSGNLSLAAKEYDSALRILFAQSTLPDDELVETLLSDYIDLMRKRAPLGHVANSTFQKELLKDQVASLPRTRSVNQSQWNKQVSLNIYDPNAPKAPKAPPSSEPRNSVNDVSALITPDRKFSDSVALDQINKQRVEFYERMIAIDIETLGANHPSVARDLSGLAYLYLSQNKQEEARNLLQRALKIYEQSYSSDLLVKRTQAMLQLIDRGNQADNEQINPQNYLSSLPTIPSAAQNIEVAFRLNYLALLAFSQSETDKAEQLYAWALIATAQSCGDQSSITGSCLSDYALVLRRAGNRSSADEFDRTAAAIVSRAMARRAAMSLP
ncbi:MAG TPA: tetratricopeptide repeat protein [Oculatellaceae cyanobacterium]